MLKRPSLESRINRLPFVTGFEFSHRFFCKWEAVASSLQPCQKNVTTAKEMVIKVPIHLY